MAKYSRMVEISLEHLDKEYDFEYIGIRSQEIAVNVGDKLTHHSLVWDDGEMTDDELPGICAIDIRKCNPCQWLYSYPGEYVLVLGSNNVQWGEDNGEIIMRDPIVLAVYKEEE